MDLSLVCLVTFASYEMIDGILGVTFLKLAEMIKRIKKRESLSFDRLLGFTILLSSTQKGISS